MMLNPDDANALLLILAAFFLLFPFRHIFLLLWLRIRHDPFPCALFRFLLSGLIANACFDIEPFLEQESALSVLSLSVHAADQRACRMPSCKLTWRAWLYVSAAITFRITP